jgi:ABC-2 type transport system ATP-binding protein
MIEAQHLSKIYGSTVAISDVHFSVAKGEILGFLGPNGAGKTTTMRILAGYIPATSGTACIAGYDIHQDSLKVRQNIGYLPETPPLYTNMTVEAYLHFVANIKGFVAGNRVQFVKNALRRCQIADQAKMIIGKLSKGYRQRIGIAQAIVHNPPVIILDEPTAGLDPKQIIEVRNLIKSLAGEHTVILSSHILSEVSMTCQRVTIVSQGSVIATENTDSLINTMKSTTIYQLKVGGDFNVVKESLESLEGVTKVEFCSEASFSMLRVSTLDRDKYLAKDLANIIINSGLELYEMTNSRPTLEEVFLKLTRQDL